MDITTKKIILLLLLLPFIFFIGLSAYTMLNDDPKPTENLTNNQAVSSSTTPTSETDDALIATIKGKYIFSDSNYSLDLRTASTNTSELSSSVSDEIKWILRNDDMSLTISTFIGESPFSTNADIEVVPISNPQLGTSLFRIPIQDKGYFYTDSYNTEECGDLHCSNGLVSISNSESIEILCETMETQNLAVCDELVKNLEIIRIY